MSTLIDLQGVTMRFGDVTAIDDCTLQIAEGVFVAVTGPSGSGKSTLLNVIGLLDQPTLGTYLLGGTQVEALTDAERAAKRSQDIGFVFQSFHLIGHRSVQENVALGCLYRRVSVQQRLEEADERLRAVGLQHRSRALAATLSGGESQRAAIARALMGEPRLLLCDEPTGNLDSDNTAAVMDLLGELHSQGKTVVIITHEDDVATRCERCIRLLDGRVAVDERKRS